ncbi:putative lipoprotein [Enhygromyxa salina]|uniref:Putative lipoprotein n=1 Tax=Enhygromyxa salina TaxID=215803 RepID=A0A0C1ZTE6_9BACT|nr:ferritin-like domain-containing protein [Enhygromyxa salina]KIG14318.1 putative lipoprotein [Enhygromyxa salina]
MRDTDLLRHRLWVQIGLPLATIALLSACDDAANVKPVKVDTANTAKAPDAAKQHNADDDDDEDDDDNDTKAATKPARTTTDSASPGYVPPARIDDIPAGEFDYFGPARDPFTEHEEEDGCPAGDWCGTPENARKFAIQHVPEKMGCPSKIISQPDVVNALNKKDKQWDGLSFHPMMQGRLMTSVTTEKRAAGKTDICCYHWFEYCSGRPLLDGEDMIVAELREGSSWSCDPAKVAAPEDRPDSAIDPSVRARLAQMWVDDALMEHAAIAAFERATLELMAMAAPPSLLGEVQAAASDEVEHAMHCFGLAARFSGLAREPGPLGSLEPRVRGLAALADHDPDGAEVGADWIRLAIDTFVEGCVGETIATLIARRAQRHCQDPAILTLLERIVDDEGRHAGLAWQTIQWITEASGKHSDAVLEALSQQAQAMANEAERACEQLPPADPDAAALGRYGRCDRRTELLARRDAWSQLILPTLAAIAQTDTSEQGPEAWT